MKIIIPLLLIAFVSTGGLLYSSYHNEVKEADAVNITDDRNNTILVSIEAASNGDIGSLGATSISWPGEIMSYGDAKITPSREGQIAELYVKIGDYVSAGESVGRLSPPPSSLELTALLSEKKQALVLAAAQEKATKQLVAESKKRLKKIESAIYRSRDTALVVAEKEAVQNSNSTTGASGELEALKSNRTATINAAKAELTQAEVALPTKLIAARAAIRALSQRFAGSLSSNGTAPDTADKVNTFQFDVTYGALSPASKAQYIEALRNLVAALSNYTDIPENESNVYVRASLSLLSNSTTSETVTAATISNLRNIILEDEQIFIEAINEFKDAQNTIIVKRALVEKMTVELDRDIIGAESTVKVNDAFLQTNQSMKENQIAQADEEFTKETVALGAKISELNRQLVLAGAEVKAATAAYELIERGTGEQMRAPKSGIISALYKNVGDFVGIDTPIAATSSTNENEKFVRFRIPLDMRLPELKEELEIEKPGYPLAPKRARVTGVGFSLDENGAYQADAEFLDPINWPANSSVRVISKGVSNFILVPFTAVWWDDNEVAKIWLADPEGSIKSRKVTLGRAFGDRIEIEEGLTVGDRFVSVALTDLVDGMIVSEIGSGQRSQPESGGGQSPTENKEGHGHGE